MKLGNMMTEIMLVLIMVGAFIKTGDYNASQVEHNNWLLIMAFAGIMMAHVMLAKKLKEIEELIKEQKEKKE